MDYIEKVRMIESEYKTLLISDSMNKEELGSEISHKLLEVAYETADFIESM